MIAVCVSGIASFKPEYEKVIELQRKVFPYDFFFQQWEGFPKPNVPNCLLLFDYFTSYEFIEFIGFRIS